MTCEICHDKKSPMHGINFETWTGNINGKKRYKIKHGDNVDHIVLVKNKRPQVITIDKFSARSVSGGQIEFEDLNTKTRETRWGKNNIVISMRNTNYRDIRRIVLTNPLLMEKIHCNFKWHKSRGSRQPEVDMYIDVEF